LSQIYKTASGGGGPGTPINTLTGNDGIAVTPTGNNVNLLGATVANGTNAIPVYITNTAASTETIQVQVAEDAASSNINNAGLASFDITDFTVDANGFVTLNPIVPRKWIDEPISFSAASGTGYFVTGTATATLPASPSQGDTIEFILDASPATLTIMANTGQMIRLGDSISLSGGTAISSSRGSTIELIYRAADQVWISADNNGTWAIT
jgi:hypothetical protein